MPDSRHDYGLVNLVRAEVFGEPGQRTFRLRIANEQRAAHLWMEKAQLAVLGTTIEGQLGRLGALRAGRGQPPPDASHAYTGSASLDVRIAQLALGFDEREGIFLLLAYAPDDEDEDRPTMSCQVTPDQFRVLAEEIKQVVAAGRPPCPLCGLPIDPAGHACARTNGHLKQPLPPIQDDEG